MITNPIIIEQENSKMKIDLFKGNERNCLSGSCMRIWTWYLDNVEFLHRYFLVIVIILKDFLGPLRNWRNQEGRKGINWELEPRFWLVAVTEFLILSLILLSMLGSRVSQNSQIHWQNLLIRRELKISVRCLIVNL